MYIHAIQIFPRKKNENYSTSSFFDFALRVISILFHDLQLGVMPPKSGKSTPVKAKLFVKKSSSSNLSTPIRFYLISYNILAALSWSYCLFLLGSHLVGSGNQSILLVKGGFKPIVDELLKRAGTAYFKFVCFL